MEKKWVVYEVSVHMYGKFIVKENSIVELILFIDYLSHFFKLN